jgi:hypothetical protein
VASERTELKTRIVVDGKRNLNLVGTLAAARAPAAAAARAIAAACRGGTCPSEGPADGG